MSNPVSVSGVEFFLHVKMFVGCKHPFSRRYSRIRNSLIYHGLTVDYFVNWLYTQKITDEYLDKFPRVVGGDPILQGLEIYVFSDRFGIPALKKGINNTIVDRRNFPPSYRTIIFAFDKIAADEPILDFLVTEHCSGQDPSEDDGEVLEERNKLPYDFLARVNVAYGNKSFKHDDIQFCQRYHFHETEEEENECTKWLRSSSRLELADEEGKLWGQ